MTDRDETGQPPHHRSEPSAADHGLHRGTADVLGFCLACLRQGQRETGQNDSDNNNPEKRTKHKKTLLDNQRETSMTTMATPPARPANQERRTTRLCNWTSI
jgi:hypothetical protein